MEEIQEMEDEREQVEIYRDRLMEVYEVCEDAGLILDVKYAKPEHTILILKDCLKKIEKICSI